MHFETLTVPKKQLYLMLTFMGKMSTLVKMDSLGHYINIYLFGRSKLLSLNRLKNYFNFEDIDYEFLAKFIVLPTEAAMLHILVKPSDT